MYLLSKLFSRFSTLNAQYLVNKSRNAVRFESQNILWDFQQLNFQSLAFSKGLASLNFQKNDNFLLRLSSAQQAQAYVSKLGTAGIQANLIVSKATTLEEADTQIKTNNIKAIIFEPTLALGSELYIDALNKLVPQLSKTENGSRVKSAKFPTLSALIQTNFYSYPGVFKFRSILNYAKDKYFKIAQDAQVDPITLPESSNSVFVTQPAVQFAYRAGILNSNVNGRFVVVVQAKDVNRVAEFYSGNVDLIGTEDVKNLNPNINVFVPKGSDLFKEHSKRTEL